MVTVVDARSFLVDFHEADYLAERGESLGESDTRTVTDLLTDQAEFSDVIVINKADLVTLEELQELRAILGQLNPRARIIATEWGQLPLSEVLNTGRFDFAAAAEAPGWLAVMRGDEQPETEEYGISSFVFRADRPFHPQRFWSFLHAHWPGMLRSKGWFWLASRPTLGGLWNLAGGSGMHQCAGYWSDTPRQELVFIGQHMERDRILASLSDALLSDAEFAAGETAWTRLPDPFPEWREADPASICD